MLNQPKRGSLNNLRMEELMILPMRTRLPRNPKRIGRTGNSIARTGGMPRLGLTPPDAAYGELQRLFMEGLPASVPLFQEYHALIVALGKDRCRPTPLCSGCPLRGLCPAGPGF